MACSKKEKKSVQSCLSTVAIGEANTASLARQEEDQKTDINGLFAEIAKIGVTPNRIELM